MSVTDHDRNQLYAWLEEHMGKERAATMMRMLPPTGGDELATKRDVREAVERLDAKIDHSVALLDLRIDHLAEHMATKADLQTLRSDLQRTFVTWILTGQVVVVTALGALLAIFR